MARHTGAVASPLQNSATRRSRLCSALAQAQHQAEAAGAARGFNYPDFEARVADVIRLHVNPLAHAMMFCLDEKT